MSFQNSDPNKQLSLFSIQQDESKASDPMDKASSPPVKNKAPRFLTLSATAHALCFILISALSLPLISQEKEDLDMVEFEIDAPVSPMSPPNLGENTVATRGAPAKVSTKDSSKESSTAPSTKNSVTAPPAPSVASVETPSPRRSALPAHSYPEKSTAVSTGTTAQVATSPISSADSTLVPTLETPELEGIHQAPPIALNQGSSEQVLGAIDQELGSEVNFQPLSDFSLADQELNWDGLDKLDQLQSLEAAQIASLQESVQASSAQATQAQQAELARTASAGNGQGQVTGRGQGNNGVDASASALAGVPTGVRSLDQFRQKPNNPRPLYDREERRRGDQGTVTFLAFINKQGVPENFKLVHSSGFRNLDRKTLVALKKWRFYPGQEGWVELPFKWDLQGGAQEDGGFLRRVGSR